jgi:hypothetical protein
MENEVQEVESTGLASRMITRRNLIKGGALVGGTVWVAPAIESFVSKASAASVLHACCECHNTLGVFIAAAADDFTDAGCVAACSLASGGTGHGTFLRFTEPLSFIAEGPTEGSPGCTTSGGFYLHGLPGQSATSCPTSGMPAGVNCDTGVY